MAFDNPIVAGNVLIREAVRSPNYVPGTSGWSINRDGSAEFADVDIRGTLESPNYVPGVSGWHLDNDGSAELQDLIMRGTWRVQNTASGDAYIEGGILGNIPYVKWTGLTGFTDKSYLMQMGDASGVVRMRSGVEPHSSQATINYVADKGIAMQASPGGASVLFDNDRGYLQAGSWAPWVPEVWNNITPAQFKNGYHNQGGAWYSAGYCKYPDGTVALRGLINCSGTLASRASGTVTATLPVGYRPSGDCIFMGGDGSGAGMTPSVRIFAATGDIQIFYLDGSALGSHSWDGIRFHTFG